MRTATWGLAVVIDALGMLLGVVYLSSGLANVSSLLLGAAVLGLYSALLAALVAPSHVARMVGSSRVSALVAALCIAMPAVALLGALDAGIISDIEWLAIFVAGLAGVLNWVALKGRVRSALWARE
jgi:hypothetical protein